MEPLPFKQLLKDRFNQLSAGQKKVAAYLIENLDKAAFKTAFQIGQQALVSETTVIRLSYALGFQGFSQMQELIQQQMLLQNQTAAAADSIQSTDKHVFTKVIENQIDILRNMLNSANTQEIWKAVEALIKADQILITGHRISHAAAYWFSYMLSTIRDQVHLCSTSGDFFEKFCNLTKDSVVVVFSFPRYSNETIKIAECAVSNGITLISITDRLLSPAGRISDIILTTEENAETGTNSIASVISLLDLVIEGIQEKDKERILSFQQKLEQLYTTFDVFNE
ncbi:MurR/RpiR family transcriptional regulator [Neobacillus drentensis]|uniref:MurR/RpiR family transcriptional regulator n=1 Tax=Neobacillus drentensis TaxID=220684 RepID=UPI002FFFF2D9